MFVLHNVLFSGQFVIRIYLLLQNTKQKCDLSVSSFSFSFSLLLLFSFSARFLQLFAFICFHPSGKPFRHFACTGIRTSGTATCARARAHIHTHRLCPPVNIANVFGRRATKSFRRATVKASERASELEAPRAPVIKENYGAADNYRG